MSIERFSLDGKVAIVTGGAGGCGEEYGRGLTAAGAQVVLADLDGERAEQHAEELRAQGRQAIGVPVDITDQDAADAMVQRATDEFGGVDILINNAALMKEIPMGSILTLPLDWWERVMKVNVMGALVCSRGRAVDARTGRRSHHQPGVGRRVHPRRHLQHQQAGARQPHHQPRRRARWPGDQRERDRARVRAGRSRLRVARQGRPDARRDPRRRCRARRRDRPTTSSAPSSSSRRRRATGSTARRSASTAVGS